MLKKIADSLNLMNNGFEHQQWLKQSVQSLEIELLLKSNKIGQNKASFWTNFTSFQGFDTHPLENV